MVKKKKKEKKKRRRKEAEKKKRKDGILAGSRGLKSMLNRNCSFRRLGREGVG